MTVMYLCIIFTVNRGSQIYKSKLHTYSTIEMSRLGTLICDLVDNTREISWCGNRPHTKNKPWVKYYCLTFECQIFVNGVG